ncbi:MAG TPA: TrkA family potassium uptake protein [Anaerolineae bacterium]|nr:TrkA family potassium uptake protein [Anaerolineae bacterium]
MNLIVVGCGRVGSELAYRLFQRGHQVSVVDSTSAAFRSLPKDFRGRMVEGEVLGQDTLRRAGIKQADGLAAVTNNDSINAVVAHVARTVYGLTNIIVRNYDPRRRPLHEAFGMQVISSTSWGAQRMEELLYQREIHSVFSAGNGEVEVYELAIPKAWHGRTLRELIPSEGCVAVALTRAGSATLPGGETRMEACDVLNVSGTLDGIESLRSRLAHPEEA